MPKLSLWRKQKTMSGKNDRMIKKKKTTLMRWTAEQQTVPTERKQTEVRKWWCIRMLDTIHSTTTICICVYVLYLFRRKYTQSASIFTDCHTHLCKQRLSVVKQNNMSSVSCSTGRLQRTNPNVMNFREYFEFALLWEKVFFKKWIKLFLLCIWWCFK